MLRSLHHKLRMHLWQFFAMACCIILYASHAYSDTTPSYAADALSIETDTAIYRFVVEIADTEPVRQRGLMFRNSLPENAGMLFDFGQSLTVSMWMKNTQIPLDMLFIAADGRITHIHHKAEPHSLTPIPSNGNIRAVLEINGGMCDRLGIRPGDYVDHPLFGTMP